MHRSAYKFGISLMASLIVFSTVASAIPMGNMNLFSDAMASGKNHDKYDNYQEYENYYSQDNQYTPDYNYNYEPIKQQQQQSSYDNNNNNSYEDTKKISYSDSYEDMKKYSTYPTKDKKYVCQTGQFQGFYVESVEFCKLKIAQGPPGPQGIQGTIGPNGIQGPPGPSGPAGIITLNDTNTYIVNSFFTQVNASSDESVFAFCDTEDSIINGGYETDTDPNNRFQVRSDVQFPFTPTNSWFVNVQNIGDNPLFFIAQAVCFDNPPTHLP